MLLFYVRHGQPIYVPDSLTPLGQRQAEAVGRRLATHGIDKVYASTSTRAIQTAQPLCDMLRLEPELLAWADEGRSWEDMHAKNPDDPASEQRRWCFEWPTLVKKFSNPALLAMGHEWYKHPDFKDFPNLGRGVERVRDEADAFFRALGYEHDRVNGVYRTIEHNDKRIAFFAHEGTGMLFLSAALDIPYPLFATRIRLCHTSITPLFFQEYADGTATLRALEMGSASHLWADRLPFYHDHAKLRY